MTESIRLTRTGDIAVVSLSRPDKRNALSLDMLHGLIRTAKTLRKDKTLRGVIIQGEGSAFCAGLDLMSIFSSPRNKFYAVSQLLMPTAGLFQRVNLVWQDLPVPVVAVVHGYCFGAGMQLALGADFIIAHPETQLSIMEAKWGMIPDMGAMVTLPDRLPRDVAKELIMTARIIDATEAAKIGLITRSADDPLAAAHALLAEISTRSPDAVAAGKKLIDSTWNRGPWMSLLLERLWQLRLVVGSNHRISISRNSKKQDIPFKPRSNR